MKEQRFKGSKSPKNLAESHPRVESLWKGAPAEVSPWRIFKIMAEFVTGYEFLRQYKKAVTIMGTARWSFDKEVYEQAEELAFRLSKMGYTIITGGGPGVMEAANKGAVKAKGRSVGINIKLPHEQRTNQYVQESEAFKYFFVRKTMLTFASRVYIFFPGGFGTLDEIFEILTLVQTEKIEPVPIILVNKKFWMPLLSWMREYMYEKNKGIDLRDMELYHLVDNAEEAVGLIKRIGKK